MKPLMKVNLTPEKSEIFQYLQTTTSESVDDIVDGILEMGFVQMSIMDMPLHRKIKIAFTTKSNELSHFLNRIRAAGFRRSVDIYGNPKTSQSLLEGIRMEKWKKVNDNII